MTVLGPSVDRCLLDGAQHVETNSFKVAQLLAAEAAERGVIAGFFGDAGVGKTHALRYYVQHCNLTYAWITSSPSPNRKEIFEELLHELTGTVEDGTARQQRRTCLEELADRQLVVVIDEAQHLSKLWLEQLRSLHDDPRARWALLLVGGVGCERRLRQDPQLWSRLALRLEFTKLQGDVLFDTLRAYHPVLAATPVDVLAEVDRRHCHGNLRNWVMFLGAALPLVHGNRGLTPRIAGTTLAKRGVTGEQT